MLWLVSLSSHLRLRAGQKAYRDSYFVRLERQALIATVEDDFIEDDDELEDLLANKSMEDNDDEDVWDEDDEYLAMIAAEGARLRASKRGESLDAASDGVEDDDDEEEDEDIDEELNVETPLDSIDPYVRFKAALSGDLFCH